MTQVPRNAHIHPGLTHHMVNQGCGGGFSIASCDADLLGIGVSSCELYFGDDPDPFFPKQLDDRGTFGDTGTLNNFGGI